MDHPSPPEIYHHHFVLALEDLKVADPHTPDWEILFNIVNAYKKYAENTKSK
jgi:hypothetical protein